MKKPVVIVVMCCCVVGASADTARAQGRGGQNWTTNNADAQRTAWIRTDPRISRESLQRPGFQLLWKTKLEGSPRQLSALTQPLLLGNIISYKGFKALAFIGSGDNVYSLDYDLNRMFWSRHLPAASSANATPQCPGGLTAITRATALTIPNPAAARVGGAPPQPPGGGPARGAPPPPAPPARAGGAGGAPNSNLASAVYAIAGDGLMHVLNPQTGEDLSPPVKFIGPGAKVAGSVLVDNILYAATADACGNVANGVYAVDLGAESTPVSKWETKGGSVAGNVGPTFASDGTVFVATADGEYSAVTYSDSVVALQAKTLALKDSFSPGRTPFTAAPVAVPYKGKDLVVAANKDGRVYLLDGTSLGGADHKTPLAKSTAYSSAGSESLASWEDAEGSRWILAPFAGAVASETRFPVMNGALTAGGIAAFKVVDQGGVPVLQPAWVSRDIPSASSPIVINGVVFALASGGPRTGSAVMYALDGATGKELWNSGSTIGSFAHSRGLSGGDGQVYVGTSDGTLYAFGIPLEH